MVLREEFGISFTRNAIVGILKRMGLNAAHKSEERRRKPRIKVPKQTRSGEHHAVLKIRSANGNSNQLRVISTRESADQYKLRCVEIVPRHLTLIELECGDCRYPYGGDSTSEAITFCGHPSYSYVREGTEAKITSSYCRPHFELCRMEPRPRREGHFRDIMRRAS